MSEERLEYLETQVMELRSLLGSLKGEGEHITINYPHISLPAWTGAGKAPEGTSLTTGNVIKATGASDYSFGQLLHSQLGSIGANDHHAQAHGAADHTNITRTAWLDGGLWRLVQTGAPDYALRGSAGANNKQAAWAFDGAATETIGTVTWGKAADYDSGSISAYIHWAPSNANSGNVYWRISYAWIAASNQIDLGATNVNTPFATPGVAEQHVRSGPLTITAPTSNEQYLRMQISRLGSNASDTYDGSDAWFFAVELEYTANQ